MSLELLGVIVVVDAADGSLVVGYLRRVCRALSRLNRRPCVQQSETETCAHEKVVVDVSGKARDRAGRIGDPRAVRQPIPAVYRTTEQATPQLAQSVRFDRQHCRLHESKWTHWSPVSRHLCVPHEFL